MNYISRRIVSFPDGQKYINTDWRFDEAFLCMVKHRPVLGYKGGNKVIIWAIKLLCTLRVRAKKNSHN
jgi:hypothetical protein